MTPAFIQYLKAQYAKAMRIAKQKAKAKESKSEDWLMTQEITLERALELVEFEYNPLFGWRVASVQDSVFGDINGNVEGFVYGSINSRPWKYIETPMQKLERLIEETGDEKLIECFNQLEDNSWLITH
jgi:hypothetical protein